MPDISTYNGINYPGITQTPQPTAVSSPTPQTQPTYSGYVKTPDNATVYGNNNGTYTPLSYDQYIQSGGPANFSTTQVVPSIPGITNDISLNPSNQTDTNALTSTPTTGTDIQSLLAKNIANQNDFFTNRVPQYLQNIQQTGQVSPEELNLQQQQTQLDAQTRSAEGQAAGVVNPTGQSQDLEFLTGAGRNKVFMAQNAAQLNQARLQYAQGNRQIAFNTAKEVFNSNLQAVQAGTQNVGALMDLMLKAAPQNIGTQYNPITGNLYAQTRNPFTGQVSNNLLGNIGSQKSYLSTDIKQLPDGSMVFIGTRADGTTEVKKISDASGNIIQSSNGSVVDQGGGSVGNGTLGSLLGYYVNGNANQLPGSGYQQAVYQAMGPGVNANTPISSLNVDQLMAGIAKAEGSPRLAAATNNPWAMLYSTAQATGIAQQYNATPYRASNGYTYASFASPQIGQQAERQYLTQYVMPKINKGATIPSTQTQIANLPSVFRQYVSTSPSGYTYINTANMPNDLANRAPYLTQGTNIISLAPDQALREGKLKDAYAKIAQAQQYIRSLPTDPYDFQRLINVFNAKLQNDPTMAQLNQVWQGAVSAMGAAGISGGRLSNNLIDRAAASDFPNPGSIQSVAQAQLDFAIQQLKSTEQTIFGQPPPLDFGAWAGSTTTNTSNPYQNFYQSITSPSAPTNTTTFGGGPPVDINQALASGGLA